MVIFYNFLNDIDKLANINVISITFIDFFAYFLRTPYFISIFVLKISFLFKFLLNFVFCQVGKSLILKSKRGMKILVG